MEDPVRLGADLPSRLSPGRWVTDRMPAIALAAVATLVVAGCARVSSSERPSGSTRAASASPTAVDPQPVAEAACYLLSRRQVESALNISVKPPLNTSEECVYYLSAGAGGIDFGISTSSATRARYDFDSIKSSDIGVSGITVRTLTGLGQQAFLLIAQGQASEVTVNVLLGKRIFTVSVSSQGVLRDPTAVVTLAREAVSRLQSTSLPSIHWLNAACAGGLTRIAGHPQQTRSAAN